jgi:hypothetical protein
VAHIGAAAACSCAHRQPPPAAAAAAAAALVWSKRSLLLPLRLPLPASRDCCHCSRCRNQLPGGTCSGACAEQWWWSNDALLAGRSCRGLRQCAANALAACARARFARNHCQVQHVSPTCVVPSVTPHQADVGVNWPRCRLPCRPRRCARSAQHLSCCCCGLRGAMQVADAPNTVPAQIANSLR